LSDKAAELSDKAEELSDKAGKLSDKAEVSNLCPLISEASALPYIYVDELYNGGRRILNIG
jgi:X-X-X-Leu-X-X-Gly heptad repeat protein